MEARYGSPESGKVAGKGSAQVLNDRGRHQEDSDKDTPQEQTEEAGPGAVRHFDERGSQYGAEGPQTVT